MLSVNELFSTKFLFSGNKGQHCLKSQILHVKKNHLALVISSNLRKASLLEDFFDR